VSILDVTVTEYKVAGAVPSHSQGSSSDQCQHSNDGGSKKG